ncbi:addiction module protein [Limnohabitans sp.]|jgi:hypothetical protein|uniref:addiction module protein n=1 Tax=Limnohabitans sp. TaxID=1907725 RepID=UPI00286F604A|nr:addiction module protein [Limnohabitans sp.]
MKLHELTQLSAQDRIQAMELLWQAMSDDAQQNASLIPAWHQGVLEARLARLQSGDEKSMPWQLAKDRLRGLTQVTT